MTELDADETARELGCSPMRVRQLVTSGTLSPRQDEGGRRKYWFDAADVARLRDLRRRDPDADRRALRARMRRGET